MTRHEPPPESVEPYAISAEAFIAFCERLPAEIHRWLELWDGTIIQMAPEGPLHMRLAQRANLALIRFLIEEGLTDRYLTSPNGTLVLAERFVFCPDVMVAPVLDGKTLPHPGMVELALECTVTTRDYDLGAKREKYAAFGVKELWIADGETQTLHVCRDPGPQSYADIRVLDRADRVAPLFAPDRSLSVSDLF